MAILSRSTHIQTLAQGEKWAFKDGIRNFQKKKSPPKVNNKGRSDQYLCTIVYQEHRPGCIVPSSTLAEQSTSPTLEPPGRHRKQES